MGETVSSFGLQSQAAMQEHYGGTPGAVLQRFNVYNTSVDGRNIHHEAVLAARQRLGEVVVDVGCGGGEVLRDIEKFENPPALMLGIDLDTDLMRHDKNIKGTAQTVLYTTASAESLPITDNSVDTLFALFMLYHVRDVSEVLCEFQRVLKPEGQLVVATSGSGNKSRHRGFEAAIADYLGIKKPPLFNKSFSSENAEGILSKNFDIEFSDGQKSTLAITNDDVPYYLDSINSMRSAFEPKPIGSVWNNAVKTLVEPVIRKEISTKGYFADVAIRDFYICRPKTP